MWCKTRDAPEEHTTSIIRVKETTMKLAANEAALLAACFSALEIITSISWISL
jgi:hypothetical protein